MRASKPKKFEISVRLSTYDKLRDYCRHHGVQMRSVVDELIANAIDDAEKRAKEN